MSPILKNIQGQIRPSDINRIVQILEDGGVIIMPVDTVYGLIAKAFDEKAFEQLENIKAERKLPYTVVFKSFETLDECYGGIDLLRKRIIKPLLPGPLTFILDSSSKIPHSFRYKQKGIGIRVSSDPNLLQIIDALDNPVWASSTNRSGEPAPVNFSEISQNLLQSVDLAIDGGPTQFRSASTAIDLRTRPYKVVREGPWLKRTESVIRDAERVGEILVICSGNVCRSPIAAAYLQHRVGKPNVSGIRVQSAGTIMSNGYPATNQMQKIASEWDLDISTHESHSVINEEIESADLILVMTPQHKQEICDINSYAEDKTMLLGRFIGQNVIPDPYQKDESDYRFTADMIKQAVDTWVDEIERLFPADLRYIESKA